MPPRLDVRIGIQPSCVRKPESAETDQNTRASYGETQVIPTVSSRANSRDEEASAEQHTIHRIEAFSDIVIGFCLAQLGLNLTMPKNGAELTVILANTAFFAIAFYFIVVLWWFHHRIFSTFFVTSKLTRITNCTMLGGLVLNQYFLQALVHVFAVDQNPDVLVRLYCFSFAFVYLLLGVMLFVGLLARRATLPIKELHWGIQRIVNIVMTIGFFAFAGSAVVVTNHDVTFDRSGFLFVLAIVVVTRVITPLVLKRVFPERI